MKNLLTRFACIALIASTASLATADSPNQVDSGPSVGDSLGAFSVTKVAGATEDGVKEGQTLCYRCRNKQRPQVVVFTRSTDSKVAELVKKLDSAMAEHSADQLRVFVNVLDRQEDSAMKKAKSFASQTGAENVPFVVPRDFATGPKNYGLADDAAITITLANDSTVKGNISVANADDLDVAMVMDQVKAMLN